MSSNSLTLSKSAHANDTISWASAFQLTLTMLHVWRSVTLPQSRVLRAVWLLERGSQDFLGCYLCPFLCVPVYFCELKGGHPWGFQMSFYKLLLCFFFSWGETLSPLTVVGVQCEWHRERGCLGPSEMSGCFSSSPGFPSGASVWPEVWEESLDLRSSSTDSLAFWAGSETLRNSTYKMKRWRSDLFPPSSQKERKKGIGKTFFYKLRKTTCLKKQQLVTDGEIILRRHRLNEYSALRSSETQWQEKKTWQEPHRSFVPNEVSLQLALFPMGDWPEHTRWGRRQQDRLAFLSSGPTPICVSCTCVN